MLQPSLTVGAATVLDMSLGPVATGPNRSLSELQVRLQLASRIFGFFTRLRGRHGIDAESFQIISGFVLAGLAELNKLQSRVFEEQSFFAELTATALSEMTDIPRQTVRRKLAALEVQGLVARQSNGCYRMTSYPSELDLLQIIQATLEPTAPSPAL